MSTVDVTAGQSRHTHEPAATSAARYLEEARHVVSR